MCFWHAAGKQLTLLASLKYARQSISSVHITNLNVPKTYVLDRSTYDPLIMDCQYEIKARECGFVLKWYFNKKLIYQWIPSRTPVGMNQFKNELQTNYSMSDSINYKYRALVIRNPKLNHSGEYMCSVQTYDSFDRRMARFQIVVPEKTLLLHYENDGESDNMLLIKCSVFMIYPEPNLLLM
ncbi:AGAP010555-PA [Anopheles gambiae str. PEST]|uniref:AGAP010555-PA n=2 Tax=gambiae species complex TaxID=44542 RepID=Q7Q8U2_ANOGA|nr:AGAP010555-PA [Anopheles gambiae str. PEST]